MSETAKRIARIRELLAEIAELKDYHKALNLERQLGEELGKLIPSRLSVGVLLSILLPNTFCEKDETRLVLDFLKELVDGDQENEALASDPAG